MSRPTQIGKLRAWVEEQGSLYTAVITWELTHTDPKVYRFGPFTDPDTARSEVQKAVSAIREEVSKTHGAESYRPHEDPYQPWT